MKRLFSTHTACMLLLVVIALVCQGCDTWRTQVRHSYTKGETDTVVVDGVQWKLAAGPVEGYAFMYQPMHSDISILTDADANMGPHPTQQEMYDACKPYWKKFGVKLPTYLATISFGSHRDVRLYRCDPSAPPFDGGSGPGWMWRRVLWYQTQAGTICEVSSFRDSDDLPTVTIVDYLDKMTRAGLIPK